MWNMWTINATAEVEIELRERERERDAGGRGGGDIPLFPSSISTSAVAFIVHVFHISIEYV